MESSKVDRRGSRVQKMFGEIAQRYDFLNHFLSGGMDWYWRYFTVRRVTPRSSSTAPILDLCTGTADLAIALWKKYRLPVVGVDFCLPMLEIGRRKVERLGYNESEIRLLEGDACQLPFDDETFQIVSVAFGLRNVENTQQGLAEMVRVCQKEGKVAILEFSMPTFPPFRWIYTFYFRHILPKIGQKIAKNHSDAYHYLPQSVLEFPQGKEMVARMEDAGLSYVQTYSLTLGIVTLYVGTRRETLSEKI